MTRCGSIALIGEPNVGKSTLLNRLIGYKLSIITPKPQTTRRRLLGVATDDQTQMLFIDTPGLFAPQGELDQAMVKAAWKGFRQADSVVLVLDATVDVIDPVLFRILSALEGRPCVQVLNKVDRLSPERLEAALARLTPLTPIPISAKTGYGIDCLKSSLISSLPQGPWLYPPDYVTDLNEKILAAEITREVLFLRLRQELPYALTVETEIWQDFPDESARLFQTIYVEKSSQRAIILSGIKSISQQARLQIQEMAERPIHLKLFVKVRPRWKQDRERYENMGLVFPKR